MKKRVWMALTCLCLSVGIYAQDSLRVNMKQIGLADIVDVLNVMQVKMFHFDLRPFLMDTYEVQLYLEEHEKGKASKRIKQFQIGKNKELLKDLPDDFRKYINLPENTEVWNKITDLSLFLTSRNDSTTLLTIKAPDAITANVALKLHPLGKDKAYFYEVRPYILRNNLNTDNLNIPLILYGSGWVDEIIGFMRFCGEKEIDGNDKTGMILSNVPHYYVVGIEFHKVNK